MKNGSSSLSASAAANRPKGNPDFDHSSHTVRDESYSRILGAAAWGRLAPEVKARFSTKPRKGRSVRYKGRMHTVELSIAGWVFAQFCRLIGTPLAPLRGRDVPMSIVLTPDAKRRGVVWNRRYEFPGARVFNVRSTKCHADNGTFIEHIGRRFSMHLSLREKSGGLEFRSVGYFVEAFNCLLQIPDLLTPGVTTVTHEQLYGDRFRFSLAVVHPLLGRTIFQEGEFYSAANSR